MLLAITVGSLNSFISNPYVQWVLTNVSSIVIVGGLVGVFCYFLYKYRSHLKTGYNPYDD